jgi:multiple sugar transport system substrate-binding protein
MTTKWRWSRRRVLQSTAALGASAGLILPSAKAPAQGGAKPYAGTTLNVSCWSGTYPKLLADYLPEFEEQTGIKVNYDTPGFPVYNQRADLELSTQGSAYDVLNITFIYVSRWIGAGWFTPLDEFLSDPNRTPPEWGDASDFVGGAIDPLKDRSGVVYGIPWTADASVAIASRHDLIEQAGLTMPETFDGMTEVLKAVHGKDGVAGYVNENHHGWSWIPYLQGFGGNVFRDPPDDLMPTLDTPEAIEAAEWYGRVLREWSPDGVLSYTYDQAVQALKQGRANYCTHSIAFLAPVGQAEDSRVRDTVAYAMMPAGPAGLFPGTAAHGWGIPTGAKNKDASWEFIKWATSREMFRRLLTEHGYGTITRRSLIESPEFRQRMTINGYDVGQLFVDVLDLAAEKGYMAYRTVHVFPQASQQINKAIEVVASQQMPAKEAMQQAQAQLVNDLRRAGVKL